MIVRNSSNAQISDRIQCIKQKALQLKEKLLEIKIERIAGCCFGGIVTNEEEVILTDEYECIQLDPEV